LVLLIREFTGPVCPKILLEREQALSYYALYRFRRMKVTAFTFVDPKFAGNLRGSLRDNYGHSRRAVKADHLVLIGPLILQEATVLVVVPAIPRTFRSTSSRGAKTGS